VFVSVRGQRLDRFSVHWTFCRLLEWAGVGRGTRRRPRIHDIRHTFAVNALLACPQGRDNVGRYLLALSTYMGHAKLADTYWYLESTPHLMQDIASACESLLNRGTP
jgi:integrase